MGRGKLKFLKRFYSPLGIAFCTALFLIACLIQGLVRQQTEPFTADLLGRIGLRSFKDSAFMLAALILLLLAFLARTVEGFIRKPKDAANLIFCGICLCVLSLLFGSAALERRTLRLWQGEPKIEKDIPYALQLTDLRIDYHNPTLYIVDTRTGIPLPEKRPKAFYVKDSQKLPQRKNMLKHHVRVSEFLPYAQREATNGGDRFVVSTREGWTPAVKVEVVSETQGDIYMDWVAYGSPLQAPAFIRLDSVRALCMAKPAVSDYCAAVNIYPLDGSPMRADSIKPNRPLRMGSRQVYLKSCQENAGVCEPFIVAEWVRDPWKNVCYAGFALIFLGILLHILTLAIGKPRAAIGGKPAAVAETQPAAGTPQAPGRKPAAIGRKPAAVAGCILCAALLAVALINPLQYKHNLMPVLNTPWYSPHVFAYIFAYTLLCAAFLLSVYALFKKNEKILRLIDILTHIGLGFLLVGISLGALWAKQAWGYFWSWDPKETWALITLLCYLLYTYMRKAAAEIPALGGRPALFMQVFGFLCLQICWYGLKFLHAAQGLSIHLYN